MPITTRALQQFALITHESGGVVAEGVRTAAVRDTRRRKRMISRLLRPSLVRHRRRRGWVRGCLNGYSAREICANLPRPETNSAAAPPFGAHPSCNHLSRHADLLGE